MCTDLRDCCSFISGVSPSHYWLVCHPTQPELQPQADRNRGAPHHSLPRVCCFYHSAPGHDFRPLLQIKSISTGSPTLVKTLLAKWDKRWGGDIPNQSSANFLWINTSCFVFCFCLVWFGFCFAFYHYLEPLKGYTDNCCFSTCFKGSEFTNLFSHSWKSLNWGICASW